MLEETLACAAEVSSPLDRALWSLVVRGWEVEAESPPGEAECSEEPC